MSQNVPNGAGYDSDCYPQIETPGARQDFLALTGARFQNANNVATFVNRFCGRGMVPNQMITGNS